MAASPTEGGLLQAFHLGGLRDHCHSCGKHNHLEGLPIHVAECVTNSSIHVRSILPPLDLHCVHSNRYGNAKEGIPFCWFGNQTISDKTGTYIISHIRQSRLDNPKTTLFQNLTKVPATGLAHVWWLCSNKA